MQFKFSEMQGSKTRTIIFPPVACGRLIYPADCSKMAAIDSYNVEKKGNILVQKV